MCDLFQHKPICKYVIPICKDRLGSELNTANVNAWWSPDAWAEGDEDPPSDIGAKVPEQVPEQVPAVETSTAPTDGEWDGCWDGWGDFPNESWGVDSWDNENFSWWDPSQQNEGETEFPWWDDDQWWELYAAAWDGSWDDQWWEWGPNDHTGATNGATSPHKSEHDTYLEAFWTGAWWDETWCGKTESMAVGDMTAVTYSDGGEKVKPVESPVKPVQDHKYSRAIQ